MDNREIEQKFEQLEQKLNILITQNEKSPEQMFERKTMDSMGRITIPKSFRKALGIEGQATEFEIFLKNDGIFLKKVLTN